MDVSILGAKQLLLSDKEAGRYKYMQDADMTVQPHVAADDDLQKNPKQTLSLWQRCAFGALLLLAVGLDFLRLGQNHYGDITTSVNSYYAAAVKSMSLSWYNFFFAAFDPGGFLAIDKPPLGFWIQVLSTRIFGFSAWSLLLPQALAGIGAIIILFILVRRNFGPNAALLAALTLTLMPISVVTSRNNTIDSLLVLVMLLAAWTLFLAIETGRVRWLFLCAVLVGLGFNIKMLEAYLILPAFGLTYLLSASGRLRARLLYLLLATLVLIVVSFSWITVVDMVPTGQRPYVSSTQHDSELELALGYNGVSRAFGIGGSNSSSGSQGGSATGPTINTTNILVTFGIANTGIPSPLRLIGPLLGGQIGWFLPFAIIGLLAACVAYKWRRPFSALDSHASGLLLWGSWFLTLLIFFSVAFFDHPYYLVTFAPAISALVGIGGVAMYRSYRARVGWQSWLLPLSLFVTALAQASILLHYPILSHLFAPTIAGVSGVLAVLLVIGIVSVRFPGVKLARPIFSVGFVILLLAPALWSALPLVIGADTVNPTGGLPQPLTVLTLIAHALIPESAHAQPSLETYLTENQDQARYLVATINAPTAAPFILDSGKPVLAFGGYNGFDQILTAQQTAALVQQKKVRFFLLPVFTPLNLAKLSPAARQELKALLPTSGSKTPVVQPQPALSTWVTANCTIVPRAVAEPGSSGPANTVDLGEGPVVPTQLFDCSSAQSSFMASIFLEG